MPSETTPQPPAIGPLTGEQLRAKFLEKIPGLVLAWSDAALTYRDAYNALAAELWPPPPKPEPVLRPWTAEEAMQHCRYWFRKRNTDWMTVDKVAPLVVSGYFPLHIGGYWVELAKLLTDYECTLDPSDPAATEPCGVME